MFCEYLLTNYYILVLTNDQVILHAGSTVDHVSPLLKYHI